MSDVIDTTGMVRRAMTREDQAQMRATLPEGMRVMLWWNGRQHSYSAVISEQALERGQGQGRTPMAAFESALAKVAA